MGVRARAMRVVVVSVMLVVAIAAVASAARGRQVCALSAAVASVLKSLQRVKDVGNAKVRTALQLLYFHPSLAFGAQKVMQPTFFGLGRGVRT